MTAERFAQLAQHYNRIPLCRSVLADCDTPLSGYLKVANGSYSYLFESVQGGEKRGRYSFVGLPCRTILKVTGTALTIETNGGVVEAHQCVDPLSFIERYQSRFCVPQLQGMPDFCGGLVGYFGYDTVRYVENRLRDTAPRDELSTPDILLMLSEELLVFDNLMGTITIVVHADPSEVDAFAKAQQRLDDLENTLARTVIQPSNIALQALAGAVQEEDFVSSFGQADYQAAVAKIKDYIIAGDVMQVVPSQRLSIPFTADPLDVYRALRYLNPSPYMYFLQLDDCHIVGTSPEILARVEGRCVTVRPLAGTRRRGHTTQEDLALEKELCHDPKEIAEHIMLVDLGRNDIGRVCKVGSVVVHDLMHVERYAHVMHLSSDVTGELKDNVQVMDVLRATLPAGTLSGAPKVRAMEIIDELEPVKRGIYGGAVGHLSWRGGMDVAIAIRTAIIKDEQLHVQAGAGIVADSQPTLEWEETMNKARSIFRAVSMVQSKKIRD